MRRTLRWLCALLGLVTVAVGARGVAMERAASAWWRRDARVVLALADRLAADMRHGTLPSDFATGSPRFDAEWALVSCQMTVLGLTRVAADHPGRAAAYQPAITACADRLASPASRAFGAEAWGADALADPDLGHAHAYLGWTAVALATARHPAAVPLTDRLAAAFAGRPLVDLATYPGETYPPDLAVAIAALHAQGGHEPLVASLLARFRAEAVDPDTGLVHQTLRPGGRGPVRGSGTALAAHFLGAVDPDLGRTLASAAQRHLRDDVGPFGGLREVPRGAAPARDIDSGPVLFGLSVSATGFGLSGARQLGDARWHRRSFRSAHAAGLSGDGWFWAGGCMGNAILLTMLLGPK